MAEASTISPDRALGALLGLAVGDAVGTTVEFRPRGSFPPVTDMTGGGPFALPAGAWTDDTSMALCLAESLAACGGFDAADQMRRYVRWWREGYWSSTGRCFDIGNTVRSALGTFERTGDPFAGSTAPDTAGNGCLMRLAPVPMFFAHDRAEAVRMSGESARPTHGARQCVDASRVFGDMLWRAMHGATRDAVLFEHDVAHPPDGGAPYEARVADIAAGIWRTKSRDAIRGSGYVIDCLEAACWCVANSDSFEDAVLLATNLGDDADTTAAVAGQLAGALYGASGIPARWGERLVRRAEIGALAMRLVAL